MPSTITWTCFPTSPTSSTIPCTAISSNSSTTGACMAWTAPSSASTRSGPFAARLSAGLQWRYDDIGQVGLYHTQARERLDTRARGRRQRQRAGSLLARVGHAGLARARDRRPALAAGALRRKRSAAAEQRARQRRAGAAEAVARVRPVGGDGDVRQRRPRLSQQRWARHGDDRRSDRPGDGAVTGRSAGVGRRLRRRHAHRGDLQSAARRLAVGARLRLRAGVHRRCRHDGGEPREPAPWSSK